MGSRYSLLLHYGVTPIHPDLCSRHIATRIAGEKENCSHDLIWPSQSPHGGPIGPSSTQDWTLIHYLLGSVNLVSTIRLQASLVKREERHIQGCLDITRTDAVNTDVRICPLHGQTRRHVPDSRLGHIIRCLLLRNIHHRAGHTANEDQAPWRLSLHEVPRNRSGKKISAIYVDGPEPLHARVRIVNRGAVFADAGTGD